MLQEGMDHCVCLLWQSAHHSNDSQSHRLEESLRLDSAGAQMKNTATVRGSLKSRLDSDVKYCICVRVKRAWYRLLVEAVEMGQILAGAKGFPEHLQERQREGTREGEEVMLALEGGWDRWCALPFARVSVLSSKVLVLRLPSC